MIYTMKFVIFLKKIGDAWERYIEIGWLFSGISFLMDVQVLTNGIEVKLQRNALSVLEPPTGNEEDDYPESEHEHWNSSDIGKPCR